jgi:tellurite resistance protein TehA-like permease
MVSATTGAMLIPYMSTPGERATMLYGCYAMFGMSLVAAMIVITLIWSRLAHFGSSNGSRVPTLWIVMGPLGQSITAVGTLALQAHLAVNAQLAAGMGVFAILFGVPVWGFAMLWAVLSASMTVRTMRRKLPFALTWWSFTFPVGVTVTGTIRLAGSTGLSALRWASLVGFVVLLGAWLVVAVRTTHATLQGLLLRPPATGSTAPVASKVTRDGLRLT